jgi:hypothetical protein
MSTPLIDIDKLAEAAGFEVSRYGVKLIVVRQNDGATVMVNDELARFARLLLAEVRKEALKIGAEYRANASEQDIVDEGIYIEAGTQMVASQIDRMISEVK